MTRILKDRGFVLRKKKFRETSKLITIFSENAGKLNLIAKGVRSPKSKSSAILEPINFIEFVYYDKQTRELQYISNADFIDDFSSIKSDFEKIKIAFVVLELTNLFSHEGQVNHELFELVRQTLYDLNTNRKSNYHLFVEFLIRLCEISGYPIFTGQCPVCQTSISLLETDFILTRNFGIVCQNCKEFSNSIINLGNETKKVFGMFLSRKDINDINIESETFKHLYIPILEFLRFHVEEIKKIKSLELF